MKTSLKLSIATAVITSVVMGSAFAANKPPKLRADKLVVEVGSEATVDVLDNDTITNSVIVKVLGGRAKYGRVACTEAGVCTYTSDANRAATHKTDSFIYTVIYKDARGNNRRLNSRVTVSLQPAPVSPA